MFVGIIASKANVNLTALAVNSEYLISGRLSVSNPSAPTKFKFRFSLSRTILPGAGINYSNGAATVTLVHRYSATLEGNEISVSKPISISNSNYNNGGYTDVNNSEGELPAGIQSGSLLIKLTYYNTDQNKTITVFIPQTVVNIQYNPPAPVPVYQWTNNNNGHRFGMTIPITSPIWNSRGIYFYAHNVQVQGSVPVYEFEGHVNDAEGQPELFGDYVSYYSTSSQIPTVLPGLGSGWSTNTPKVLFYAFPTQVEGTIPVYCYSNEQRNSFLFMATGEKPSNFTTIGIVFYAYPVATN